eukprot:Nitzschia sp. Nitz4//scaffold55_size114948//57205//59762//NITZ4_003901-RA/size114948-processed-gene-0.68-mRNA-1//-1//CDS//3329554530//4198//frame0
MRFSNVALHALALLAVSQVQLPFSQSSTFLVQAQEDVAPETVATPSAPLEDGFLAPKDAETFAFEAEVSRMLDIVINSLYQNKDVFLRELISNASDALDKIRFMALTKPDYLAPESKLQVQIEFDAEANTLTVRDTGIGMTHDDMVENLGTVARSGTTRFLQALKEGNADGVEISQIGQFGVGFYSAFLVADRVQVASKHPESNDQYVWTSMNGASDFQIFKDPRGNTLSRGTEVTLFLKEDCMEYADQYKLEQLATHYSEFVVHPIYLQTIDTITVDVEDEEEEVVDPPEPASDDEDLQVSEEEATEKPKKTKEVTVKEWEHLNQNQAIWTRSKDEIADDEYKSFYRVIADMDDADPERWTHFQAEGNINFKSILYLPRDVPPSWKMGMMGTEKSGLSLYVQKVLISDEFELLPRYLSFMRGVVDSDDLPLNVNRETLQESKIIQVIKKKVVRKALELLKSFAKEAADAREAAEDDEEATKTAESYNDWYKRFAPTLKLGAIEDEPNRNKILKLLRYKSTKSSDPKSWISLDDYIKNMKDWQKDIYFVAGMDLETVEKSQFLEPFLAKGVEVLYLTDPVDEYVTQTVRSYEGKMFKNIATENVELKDDEEDEDLIKRRDTYYKDKFKPLTKWLKKLYGNSVMRVAISKRLVTTPAIASSSEFGHSANTERILRAQAYTQGQDDISMRSLKVFELNPRHPFVVKLLEGAPPEDAGDDFQVDPKVEDAAWVLHEMGLLSGGFPLSDPVGHTQRMLRMMMSDLGVDSLDLAPEPDLSVLEEEAPDVFDMMEDDIPENVIPVTMDEDGNINMDNIEL